MTHLSIRELNKIVEEAKILYRSGINTEAVSLKPYVDAFKAARAKQPTHSLLESSERLENEELLRARLERVENSLEIEATEDYQQARDFANENESSPIGDREQRFEESLRATLREKFIVEDPVFAVIIEIDRHIQQFRSPANWFQRSAQDKIEALEILKEMLLESENDEVRTIPEIIDAWKPDHEPTITSSRNIFKSQATDLLTSTAYFIKDLRLAYQHETSSLRKDSELTRADKVKFYQPFLAYIQARTTWLQQILTTIFRITELSDEKLTLAKDVVEKIQDCDSYETLNSMLATKKEEHTELSKNYGQLHYNLDDRGEIEPTVVIQTSQYEDNSRPPRTQQSKPVSFWNRDVKGDQLISNSDLASAFHDSISMIP